MDLLLLIAGLVCLAGAALNISARVSLGWLGLLLLFLREVV